MSNKRNIKLAESVLNTKATAELDEEVKKILEANIADPPKFGGGPPFCQDIPPHTICGKPSWAFRYFSSWTYVFIV